MTLADTVPASARNLPDVAADAASSNVGVLDWVGMDAIEAPITLSDEHGQPVRCAARVTAFVDLAQAKARGIHMSRLYLHVDRALSEHVVSPALLRGLLGEFLASHGELSTRALIRIRFEHLVRRSALLSDHSGWRSYPVTLTGRLEQGRFDLEMAFRVLYSSTCPCSAALARQLIQERFQHDFAPGQTLDRDQVLAWLGSEQGIHATPHSQRSAADVKLRLHADCDEFPLLAMIDRLENALQTPVQTAVKREDEQAFAGLNGANPMFCEDAARRMQAALDSDARIADFWLRASHFESLHPHDAVAVASKGVPGGYHGGLGD